MLIVYNSVNGIFHKIIDNKNILTFLPLQPYLPSPEEAYDFFTRIWEAEPEEETAATAAVGAGPAEAGVGDDKEPGAKSEEPKKENEQEVSIQVLTRT